MRVFFHLPRFRVREAPNRRLEDSTVAFKGTISDMSFLTPWNNYLHHLMLHRHKALTTHRDRSGNLLFPTFCSRLLLNASPRGNIPTNSFSFAASGQRRSMKTKLGSTGQFNLRRNGCRSMQLVQPVIAQRSLAALTAVTGFLQLCPREVPGNLLS